jgi:hypothetical protein
MTAHRNARDAERQLLREGGKRAFGVIAAGRAVGNYADGMSAHGLLEREIEDMTKQPSDRSAEYVKDAKRRHRLLAAQNQRS